MRSFVALACLAALSASALAEPGTSVNSGGGRYAIGQISASRHDQYMVDTQTGRLWTFVCIRPGATSDLCSQVALQPVVFIDLEGRPLGLVPAPMGPLPKQ
jgi:hypothetical protein